MILKELLVRLGLDVDAQSFAKGQLAAGLVEASLKKLVEIGKEAVHAFVENVHAVAEYGESVTDLAQQAGLSTDRLQQLGKAAATEGIAMGDFAHSMVLLSRTMAAAKGGSEEQGKAFKQLGVHVTDAHGKMRGADEVFTDVAEKFHGMEDGANKTALALKLFGRSGASMIPLLNQGAEELEQFKSAAVMSPEQLHAGKEVVIVQRQIAMQSKILWREAIGPLLPTIRDLLKQYLAWKKANAEVMKQRIKEWVGYLISAIRALGGVFSFLIKNIGFFKAIAVSLIPVFAVLGAKAAWAGREAMLAWMKAAAPFVAIGAIIAAMLLVFDDIRVYLKGGDSLYGRFKGELEDWLKPRAEDPWFVVAIKQFVGLMNDAVKVIQDFDVLTGKAKPAISRGRVAGPQTAEEQAQSQIELEAMQGYTRKKAWADAIFGDYGVGPWLKKTIVGEAPVVAADAGRRQVAAQQTNYVTVNTQPGADGNEMGRQIAEQFEIHWDRKMEDAAPAVSR